MTSRLVVNNIENDTGVTTVRLNPNYQAFEINNAERLRITSDGKIGIGEDDPDGNYLLIRAASTVGTTKGHIMLTGDGATNGEGPQIVFSESGSGSNFAGAYIGHVRTTTNSVGDLVFGTRATGGDANTIPTERLRITSTGRVGINENSPDRDLHISNTTPYIRVESTSANQPATLELYHTRGNGSDKWPVSVATDDAALTFNVAAAANGTPAERLRITSAGQVNATGNIGVQTTTVEGTDLVGAGTSFFGAYIGDGMLAFHNRLDNSTGYYVAPHVNALNAGPITLGSTMTLDGTWVII